MISVRRPTAVRRCAYYRDVPQSERFIDQPYRLLLGLPVSTDVAAGSLARGPGAYAWWALPTVLPQIPGVANEKDRNLRLLYAGRAANLRGRILKTHLRRSGGSELRRILAGLLMPTEGYRTMWKDDEAILVPEDELRLTSWMRRGLRLTWVEHPYPEDVEGDLIARLAPPLNVHGTPDSDIRSMVVAAKQRLKAAAGRPGKPG